jgi:PadR family transcriptional regulator PadR
MKDFINCPCAGGTLDRLIQPAILAALAEQPAHGYRIAERIAEMPNFLGEKPDVSGIYRFLKSMESKGLVVSSWETPGQGHAKRLYEITSAGEKCLAQWAETLETYLAIINGLLEVARAAMPTKARKAVRRSAKRSCCQ